MQISIESFKQENLWSEKSVQHFKMKKKLCWSHFNSMLQTEYPKIAIIDFISIVIACLQDPNRQRNGNIPDIYVDDDCVHDEKPMYDSCCEFPSFIALILSIFICVPFLSCFRFSKASVVCSKLLVTNWKPSQNSYKMKCAWSSTVKEIPTISLRCMVFF